MASCLVTSLSVSTPHNPIHLITLIGQNFMISALGLPTTTCAPRSFRHDPRYERGGVATSYNDIPLQAGKRYQHLGNYSNSANFLM